MSRLQLTAQAAQQIATITTWWIANRPSAPALFTTELERIFALIESQPGLGPLAEDADLVGVRRIPIGP